MPGALRERVLACPRRDEVARWGPIERTGMPRYRVTVKQTSFETIEAQNPFMAAVAARERHGDGAEIVDVRPAVGRPAIRSTKKTVKKVAKKRRRLSPEARAKLAQNLVKARAARAAKAKAAKKSSKKTAKRL